MNLKTTNTEHIKASNELASRYDPAKKARLADAAKQFESMLTSMMLKSMTDTTEDMFGSQGFGGDMFDGIFQNKIAGFITDKDGMGIADMIFQRMTGQSLKTFLTEHNKEINDKLNEKSVLDIKTGIDKDVPKLSPSVNALNRLDQYEDYINEASSKFGVDSNIIKSVILTESAANANAVSGAKAKGLMQLIDSTAADMGVKNSFDPKDNILGGTKYLAQMLKQYDGNLKLSLAAYNAGPNNVDKYKGVPPFEETQNYINRVFGYLKHLDG